jgi:hypothetical protein
MKKRSSTVKGLLLGVFFSAEGRQGRNTFGKIILSAFRDRGVPKPTSECRCVPQPRWAERVGEREGGK